jgi:hypothetical protein
VWGAEHGSTLTRKRRTCKNLLRFGLHGCVTPYSCFVFCQYGGQRAANLSERENDALSSNVLTKKCPTPNTVARSFFYSTRSTKVATVVIPNSNRVGNCIKCLARCRHLLDSGNERQSYRRRIRYSPGISATRTNTGVHHTVNCVVNQLLRHRNSSDTPPYSPCAVKGMFAQN